MSKTTLTEVFLAGEQKETDDGIWLEILREGEFAKTPLGSGTLDKPFKVVRSGFSNPDPENLVVSMEELVNNFNDKAFEYVTVPLSHDDGILENTGYIDELKIEEDQNGVAKLWAKHRFTEKNVEEKIKSGSIPSRSAGIFFNFVRKLDGKKFTAALKHVTPTDTPWITGLNPYGVFASDEEEPDSVVTVAIDTESKPDAEVKETIEPKQVESQPKFDTKQWMEEMLGKAKDSLAVQFNLNGDYEIVGLGLNNVVVKSNVAETSWVVPYNLEEDDLILASIEDWRLVSGELTKPSVATAQMSDEMTPLQEAQKTRELRLSQRNGSKLGGKSQMAIRDNRLEGLELSDEARGLVESLMAENKSLQDEKSKAHIEDRIEELKGLGLDKHPGFLKTVRDIYLSDDGGPAMVLTLSDDNGNPTGEVKEQTATDIVDRLIAALPRDAEQKIALSAQHLVSDGNHEKPEVNEPSHDEKVAEWKDKLFPEINRRKKSGGE